MFQSTVAFTFSLLNLEYFSLTVFMFINLYIKCYIMTLCRIQCLTNKYSSFLIYLENNLCLVIILNVEQQNKILIIVKDFLIW